MELDSYVPTAVGYFNNLNQPTLGIHTGAQHPGLFELSAIRAAEFVTGAMPFFDRRPAVCVISF